MIFWIGKLLAPFPSLSFLRLAEYLSARSIGAALTAVLLTLWLTPKVIWWLQRRAFVDQVRETGIPSAFDKAGTPVMGASSSSASSPVPVSSGATSGAAMPSSSSSEWSGSARSDSSTTGPR